MTAMPPSVPMNDVIADRVWDWINDAANNLEALFARTPEDRVIGLAHFRAMPPVAPSASLTISSLIPNSAGNESPTN